MDNDIFNQSAAQQRAAYLKMSPEEQKEYITLKYGNAPAAPATPTTPAGNPANIIPPAPTPVVNGTTSTANKCPSCGATLAFDPATGGLTCNFCGASVALNTMPAAPGIGYSLEDLNYTAGQHYLRMVNKLIVCGTCGGTFVADQSAMSGLCPYC